jgi:hypothetical protein
MLSFEEFKAVHKRNERKEPSKVEKVASANSIPTLQMSRSATGFQFGQILESSQFQTLFLIVLVMDTFMPYAEQLLVDMGNFGSSLSPFLLQLSRLLFTLLVVELVSIFCAFPFSVFAHFGYVIDFIIMGSQVYLKMRGLGRSVPLLNIFRVWRFVRLITTLVENERKAHDETRNGLELSQLDAAQLRVKLQQAENDLAKEKSARSAVEEMITGYKEEVDTLNEALKIAAMDIAAIGQDEDIFGEELNEAKKKETPANRRPTEPSSDFPEVKLIMLSSPRASQAEAKEEPVIVISEDGTFTRK